MDGIYNFFPLVIVSMHRDVERTLIHTIYENSVKYKNKIECCSTRERERCCVWSDDMLMRLILVLESVFGLVRLDAIVMIVFFVPLESSSCHFLLP